MDINLYKVDKRINSTKIPEDGWTVEVTLKAPTDILRPTFIVHADALQDANYISCEMLGKNRYYRISECTILTNELVQISCSMDVLATYKSEIGEQTLYIDRASNADAYAAGTRLVDNTYAAKAGLNPVEITSAFRPRWRSGNGVYILGIVCDQAPGSTWGGIITKRGGIWYLALSQANAVTFLYSMMLTTAEESTYDPLQFIKSFTYLPINIGEMSPAPVDFILFSGGREVAIPYQILTVSNPNTLIDGVWTGYGIYDDISSSRWHMFIPEHPQADRGEFLNYLPYTAGIIHGGPFGDINLDTEMLNIVDGDAYLGISFVIDLCTGDAILRLHSDDTTGHIIQRANGHVGISIPVNQIVATASNEQRTSTELSVVGSAIGIASSIATGNVAGAASSVLNIIKTYNDYSLYSTPHVTSLGSTGSFADYSIDFTATMLFRYITPEHLDDIGRPVGAPFQIATIPGYIKCSDADIMIEATTTELNEIQSFLLNGFHYE